MIWSVNITVVGLDTFNTLSSNKLITNSGWDGISDQTEALIHTVQVSSE